MEIFRGSVFGKFHKQRNLAWGTPPGGGGTLHGWEGDRKQEGKRSNQPLTLQPEHDTLIKFGAAAHVSLSQGLQGRQAQPGGHLLRDCDG